MTRAILALTTTTYRLSPFIDKNRRLEQLNLPFLSANRPKVVSVSAKVECSTRLNFTALITDFYY